MALPPTIPTSFVPHSAAAPQRFRADLTGAFGFFGYAVLGVVFVLACGIFFYGRILDADLSAKNEELKDKVNAIDSRTVEGFIRLRDRLDSGRTLLGGHMAFSTFFSELEKIQLTTLRFTALHLSLGPDGMPKVEGAGVAKSFNALAAASTAFATDGRIRNAIFSDIVINKDNSVSFSLAATLHPDILVFSP